MIAERATKDTNVEATKNTMATKIDLRGLRDLRGYCDTAR